MNKNFNIRIYTKKANKKPFTPVIKKKYFRRIKLKKKNNFKSEV